MATLMEKDVLLELTTSAMAVLAKHGDITDSNVDNLQLHSFYGALIKNPPEIFDFKNMVAKIKEIYYKYEL